MEGSKSVGERGPDGLTLGVRLQAARKAAGYKRQADLKVAVLGGEPEPGTISRWETDKTEPTASEVRKLSRLLGISAHWLVMGEGPMTPLGQPDAERKLAAIRKILDEPVSPPAEGSNPDPSGTGPHPEDGKGKTKKAV